MRLLHTSRLSPFRPPPCFERSPLPLLLPLLVLLVWVPLAACGRTLCGAWRPVRPYFNIFCLSQESLQAFFAGYLPGAGLAEPHFHLDMGYPQSLPTVRNERKCGTPSVCQR